MLPPCRVRARVEHRYLPKIRAYYYATLEYYHKQKVRTSVSCTNFQTFSYFDAKILRPDGSQSLVVGIHLLPELLELSVDRIVKDFDMNEIKLSGITARDLFLENFLATAEEDPALYRRAQ